MWDVALPPEEAAGKQRPRAATAEASSLGLGRNLSLAAPTSSIVSSSSDKSCAPSTPLNAVRHSLRVAVTAVYKGVGTQL